MIRKGFVNRERELESLKERKDKEGFEFVVMTGRRRVGKTRILQEFSKEKNNIFLLCEDRKWEYNLDKFNKAIADYYEIPDPGFDSFRDCFRYISSQGGPSLVIIDEFSYLIKNKEIPAEFQGIVDEILSNKDILLLLSGSSISMMKKHVLGHKSPLYGRSTSQINLQPLKFKDLFEWFEGTGIREIIKIYGVCDGIPKYLEFFSGEDVEKEIEDNLFNPDSFLFREPKFLLEEELREPETYFQILESISLGNRRTTEIANHSYMEAKNVSSYLSVLRDLGFVRKETSILSGKRKRGLYKIKDNFFDFWFHFVASNFSEIESWQIEPAKEEFKGDFDIYLSGVFEEICRQLAKSIYNKFKVGRWWYKNNEIDIVALNENKKEIVFGECKWSKNEVGKSVLHNLEETSQKVRWHEEDRQEKFALFSKSSFTSELKDLEKEREDLELYDLDRMEEAFKGE